MPSLVEIDPVDAGRSYDAQEVVVLVGLRPFEARNTYTYRNE
jgi:hypothetical protein